GRPAARGGAVALLAGARPPHRGAPLAGRAPGGRAGADAPPRPGAAGRGRPGRGAGEYLRGRALAEESLALCRALGDRAGLGEALGVLGGDYQRLGDYATARRLL